ncbi:hypothetical protein [Burkholderia gladioli]|uniref:hypothetical protein n=1 Tax=Burkholderia gladioli TaxID=28095 RepID=UPI00163EEA71|nr:hypothetical protein [Burkholderia gladioli]
MKSLLFVATFFPLRVLGGAVMLVAAVGLALTHVPTPANLPFQTLDDVTYPWLQIILGAIGALLIVSACRAAERIRRQGDFSGRG